MINEIIDYISKDFGIDDICLVSVGKYNLLDLSNLEQHMAIISNFICQDDKIVLDKTPQNNQLSINNIDYYAYSVSPQFRRNKGAH